MAIPGLDDFTGFPAQNTIVLGGVTSPGMCRVEGAGSLRTWDKRKGYGLSGAYLVYTGTDLSAFSVFFDLWEEDQFLEWDAFARAVLDKPLAMLPFGVPVKGLGIQHPQINGPPLNIHSVVVAEVGQFTQDDYGLWTCEVKFIEYKAPLPALGKVNGAIPAVGTPSPRPEDKQDAVIAAQDAQIQALAKTLAATP